MITTGQIRDGINQLLIDQLHADTVYVNRCPKDFDRPSYWIETVRTENASVNYNTVKKTVYFSVTCFIALNGYSNSDSIALTDAQDAVVGLFRSGFMKVGDRSISASANSAGYENDRAYVDLKFEFFDDRSDEADNTPLMGDLDVSFEKG